MTIEEALVAELRTMKGTGCPKAARATTDCLRSAITGTSASRGVPADERCDEGGSGRQEG